MNTFQNIKKTGMTIIALLLLTQINIRAQGILSYLIVDTGQETYYDTLSTIPTANSGSVFYGQDANYNGYQPSYSNNGDGTVSDNVSELMWVQTMDLNGDGIINVSDKLSFSDAQLAADTFSLAGYSDWRVPSIKEMYSLILFSGEDPSGYSGTSTDGLTPFIDTNYFGFGYGDLNAGERLIDAQLASSTQYVSTTMNGNATMFGVNFADGRIKGYPSGPMPGQTVDKQFYVMFVRGNTDYGLNNLQDNNDSTITDQATGLMWSKYDSGQGLDWVEALAYAENANTAGYGDWRLPNAKELQSILDYTRSPATTSSAAIDPMFDCTSIIDGLGNMNYPSYWSSTTHANMSQNNSGGWGAYVCFGEGQGWMEMPPNSGNFQLLDVHGAGAQRSDPKTGDPADYPNGHGPQGDVVYVYNYVRMVRDAGVMTSDNGIKPNQSKLNIYPNPADNWLNIACNEGIFEEAKTTIYSVDGQIIEEYYFNNNGSNKINISNLETGMYFLKWENNFTWGCEIFMKK